jgi:hypothetical protein
MRFRNFSSVVLTCSFAACSVPSHPTTLTAPMGASNASQSLAYYESLARLRPVKQVPTVGQNVPPEYGVPVRPPHSRPAARTASAVQEASVIVAVPEEAATASAHRRATAASGDCYYIVTIDTDESTGESTVKSVTPLGCDDGTSGGGDDSSDNGGSTVAVYATPPTSAQKCGGSGYGYEDNLPLFQDGTVAQVENINEVYDAAGNLPFGATNGNLAVSVDLIGWYYQDQWGDIFFQPNPVNGWYPSISIALTNGLVSMGVTWSQTPNTTAGLLKKPNGTPLTILPPQPTGQTVASCWSTLGVI